MTVEEVLAGSRLLSELPTPLASQIVTGLAYDSRQVERGFLFFAFPGSKADGRSFAAQALARGAVAVVSDLALPADGIVPWLQVSHGRRALAAAAKRFYGCPDERIALIGVTGTNGKTTTSFAVDALLRNAGYTTALIGTIEYHLAGRVLPAANTTPESLDTFKLLAELVGLQGTHATMEVSSHALSLGRVYGLRFDTAIFTNLTRDHLDFHGTMDEYFLAKQRLFTGENGVPPRCAAVNVDDPYGQKLQVHPQTQVLRFGLGEQADVRATDIRAGFDGLRFTIEQQGRSLAVRSPLVGTINVYNLLAAYCAGLNCGLAQDALAESIAQFTAVPGRFERVDAGQPFLVLVDYAHTDDALRNLIRAARELSPARVITLFGCGGDRDRTKRPLMGAAAAELSDFVVLTSDNPRSEDPLAIIKDALAGVTHSSTPYIVEADRRTAIGAALQAARPGDIVLLAGKGHETYQVLQDRTIHFDDRECAREWLQELSAGWATR